MEASDQKTLDAWTDDSVSIATQFMFNKGNSTYTFPRKVFAPEATQEQVFDSVLGGASSAHPQQSMLDCWTGLNGQAPRNVLLLAYGQTGTGKTHSMFGTDRSLLQNPSEKDKAEGWGLVPRAVSQAMGGLKKAGNREFIVSGSAVEFYCGFLVLDLLIPVARC